jgi:hypothetical protein
MPVLPLDHPEPFAATLGVMLYPGTDEAERRKAGAFTTHYLAEPLRRLQASGAVIPYNDLSRIAIAGGQQLTDLKDRWWRGSATGELFKTVFALANTDPKLASWTNAVKIVERISKSDQERAGRSFLWDKKKGHVGVAHLWAAWSIRGRTFEARPEVGYDLTDDFQSFLTEAEILRAWGQKQIPARAKGEPLLPADIWHVPEGWRPPKRRPGWPDTGQVPKLTLSAELVAGFRPAGRPRRGD